MILALLKLLCCCLTPCCKCERPTDNFCCFGDGDVLNFRFWMNGPVTWHDSACLDGDQTQGGTCNAVDTNGDYDFIACIGGYVIWRKQDSEPECLPFWVFQPCDTSSEYILLNEDESEWFMSQCMDCSEFNNIPQLCTAVSVCPLTLGCCRPGGSGDPTETVHLWDSCCFVVDPNTCSGIGVEWWCEACSYLGGDEWGTVCLNFGWETSVTFNACTYNEGTQECDPV